MRRISALSCVLPSYDQASECRVTKGSKTFCYSTRPFSCLNRVNAIQGVFVLYIMDPVQIIANIPGSESPDLFGFETFECLNGCVVWVLYRDSKHREIT